MDIKTYKIPIDVTKGVLNYEIPVLVTGDTDVYEFEFHLIKDSILDTKVIPYDLTGCNVILVTSGKSEQTDDVTIFDAKNGIAKIILKNSMYSTAGQYKAELQIYDVATQKTRLTTPLFVYKARRSLQTDESVQADNNYGILEKILEKAEQTISAIENVNAVETEALIADMYNLKNQLTTQSNEVDVAISSANSATGKANTATTNAIAATTNAISVTDLANAKIVDIEKRFNDLTAKQQQDAEVIDARKGKPSLKAKMDEVDSQINQIATNVEVHEERIYDVEMKLKAHFHYSEALGEYVNLDKFWNSFRNGKIYTTEFYNFDVSPSSSGIKKDDNEGLFCEPSTNTYRGKNDYEKIGLFMSINVNAYVDENDDYHVTAIEGDGRFKRDGTNGDVYVMAMTGYQKHYQTGTSWGISYSDTMHSGFEILDEAVKPDGTIRPFLLHAKYVAGRNPYESNNLASISGVYPEYSNMSHNGQIAEFAKKGTQYSGKTSHDDYYVQLMVWLKYATMNSQSVMRGCENYYLQYANLVAEKGVKRVIITNAQASNLLVGSTVSIGDYGAGSINADRQVAQNYNLANRVNITEIVDLGSGNSAVYVDTINTFDTTLTTTITTYPWNSGSCDNVLGQDGSPYSNTSGKEPFIINGIEMMVGGYEVLQNLIILNNVTDNRIDVYANYDCKSYATSITDAYDLVGQLAQTNNAWRYGSKISITSKHPTIILVTETEASSTTGTGDGIYTNPPSSGGTRVWHSLGYLYNGAIFGLRCLRASSALSYSYWFILGRLSATGRSRRRAGVN